MAWIRTIDEADAVGRLAEEYDRLSPDGQPIDNILKIHSLHPRSLRVHFDFYKLMMRGPSPLSHLQREMIAVTASATNSCHY